MKSFACVFLLRIGVVVWCRAELNPCAEKRPFLFWNYGAELLFIGARGFKGGQAVPRVPRRNFLLVHSKNARHAMAAND
jgi:hypothetical protein